MSRRNLDFNRLAELKNQNKSGAEISVLLGVSQATISRALKDLEAGKVKVMTLEAASEVVSKEHFDVMEQLKKINGYAHQLLDLLMAWSQGDDLAGQKLKNMVGTKSNQAVPMVTQPVLFGDDPHAQLTWAENHMLAIRCMGEIRSQTQLYVDMVDKLYNFKEMEDFQQEILAGIGEVAPDVRDRILRNLAEKRALRQVVGAG